MFRSALRELKFHPGRYIATLLAIAISVGFMAAASIVTATQSKAIGSEQSVAATHANILVTIKDGPDFADNNAIDTMFSNITAGLKGVSGVEGVEPVMKMWATVTNGDKSVMLQLTALPSDTFMWSKLSSGEWPTGNAIAINESAAKTLGVKVGDTVTVDSGEKITVSGITTDVAGMFGSDPGFTSTRWFTKTWGTPYPYGTTWMVKLADGVDTSTALDAITQAMDSLKLKGTYQTAAEYRKAAESGMTDGIDGMKYLLWVFAGIAMVVGLITISNTFTILLAQRRRQIGLMRAIGASGAQVRHSVLAEAIILGLVGGVVGIVLATIVNIIVSYFTGALRAGVAMPWLECSAAVLIGLIITVIASVAPARKATKVPPIAALQPTTSDPKALKISKVRLVVCAIIAGIGFALCACAFHVNGDALIVAVSGAAFVAIGVLFGARLFVPALLKGVAAIVSHWGVSAKVAAKNVTRDPSRASATATALMLAVGLIITLQVGAASMLKTMMDKIDQEMPVALSVQGYSDANGSLSLNPTLVDQMKHINGVLSIVDIPCRMVDGSREADTGLGSGSGNTMVICSYVSGIASSTPGAPASVSDTAMLVPEGTNSPMIGQAAILPAASGTVSVTPEASKVATWGYFFVSPATYAKLAGPSSDNALLFLNVDLSKTVDVMRDVQAAVAADTNNSMPSASVSGSLAEKYSMQLMLDIFVNVLTGLLGVAVLIALVGVSNTLTLSVIERTHEFAILRAIGFKKGQLKIMLLIEAVMLTLIGAVVGLGFGAFFGWLGAESMVRTIASDGYSLQTHFALNWWQTAGLLGVLVLAAVLASLLPGRRAAKASPVEALAEV